MLTFFDMQEELLPAFFPLRERLARRLLNRAGALRASRVIAASDLTAQALVERWSVPAARVDRVPIAVGERFHPEPEPGERDRLRSRYPLLPDDFALYPAHPWPHKNHDRLLAAIDRLGSSGCPLRLVCTGALRGGASRGGGRAARSRSVVDLGFVAEEDVPALYRAARVLVFPSLFEGFGLPVLEALASGCPVACSRIPPLVELADGVARFFDPLDPASMARAIREAWQDASLRAALAAGGLERARAYRWEVALPALYAVYRRALGGGSSVPRGGG